MIAQLRVEATTNEHKAALRRLGVLPPRAGVVVTADAMFTHADIGRAILDRQGDYILYAKASQPTLRDDITAAASGGFSPLGPGGLGRGRAGRDDPG